MTMYSRSDVAAISISPSHGGCGSSHRRPVEQGAPAKLWALSCVMCENHLRTDPLWSATVAEIPETPDEEAERSDYEKRGANDIQTMLAIALTNMTGGEIPETVARMVDGSKSHLPSAKVLCPAHGHANAPGLKFCGECGTSMRQAAVKSLAAPEPREAALPPRAEGSPDLAKLHPQKLRKMCRERGLPDSGRVPEMVARLQDAERVAA
jgi:hypothetical protein